MQFNLIQIIFQKNLIDNGKFTTSNFCQMKNSNTAEKLRIDTSVKICFICIRRNILFLFCLCTE